MFGNPFPGLGYGFGTGFGFGSNFGFGFSPNPGTPPIGGGVDDGGFFQSDAFVEIATQIIDLFDDDPSRPVRPSPPPDQPEKEAQVVPAVLTGFGGVVIIMIILEVATS